MSEHQKLGDVPKFSSNIEQIVRDQFPQTVDANGRFRDHPTLQILDGQSVMRQAQDWCNAQLRTTHNMSVETETLMVALEQKINNISSSVEKKINKALWWFVGICGASIITGIVAWSFK